MRSSNQVRWPLAVAGLSLTLLAAERESHAAESVGLRVLTYNVAQLSTSTGGSLVIPECSTGFFGIQDDDCVGLKLGDALLLSDYDVILLNELFDDGVRAKLTTRLSGRYPFWANRFDTDEVGLTDASGLPQVDDSGSTRV